MNPPVQAPPSRLSDVPHSAAQLRIVTAALELFPTHGVSGTSLQMIADAVGVTKAAVYHQFKTKDEIVIATAEVELARLERAVEAAEAEDGRSQAIEVLLAHVIDLAVSHRRVVRTLQTDPVMVRLLAEHEPFRQLMDRLYRVLLGDDVGAEAWVQAALLSAAIGGAVMHPLVVGLDDETLRSNLLVLVRRFLRLDG